MKKLMNQVQEAFNELSTDGKIMATLVGVTGTVMIVSMIISLIHPNTFWDETVLFSFMLMYGFGFGLITVVGVEG